MRATRLSRPEGCTRMRSPGRRLPLASRPQKPRKSRLGRLTHCTGRRSAPACRRVSSISVVSRKPISVGPVYQGVRSLGDVMLSPFSAESGIVVMSARPICAAKAR